MDSAFIFNRDVAVKVNGKQLDSTLYTLTTDTSDDCTFHVTMDLVKIYQAGGYFTLEEIENCPKIVVTYSAVLSEDATSGTYTVAIERDGEQYIVTNSLKKNQAISTLKVTPTTKPAVSSAVSKTSPKTGDNTHTERNIVCFHV